MFISLDTDNNGFLTLDELEVGMRDISEIFELDKPDVRKIFKAADINDDKKIDYTEFIAAAF